MQDGGSREGGSGVQAWQQGATVSMASNVGALVLDQSLDAIGSSRGRDMHPEGSATR
jgi:hypothetical protein